MVLKSGKYEYQSGFARKYVAQGREEGRESGLQEVREEGRQEGLRAAVLEVLEARGLLTEDARTRVAAESEALVLEAWLRRAADALEAVFA
jgi:hypothetical protein